MLKTVLVKSVFVARDETFCHVVCPKFKQNIGRLTREPVMGDSLSRRDRVQIDSGRDPFRDAFLALKRTVQRANPFVPPAQAQPVACPKCHWNCVRRSRRRTGLDALLALVFLRPFRCRSCRRRYYRLSF